jgi:uncharacterized protein (DUF433 family)
MQLNKEETALFTTSEAAAVSGIAARRINRFIDEGPLRNSRRRNRKLSRKDILFLKLLQAFGGVQVFSKSGRAVLYRAIASYDPSKEPASTDSISGPARLTELLLRDAADELEPEISKLTRARQMVVTDADIRGGEPVIKDTRIPVHMIAELLGNGADESEIEQDYRLSAEQIELAVLYAKAYPKRGRPPKHPWRRKPLALPD